MLLCEVCNRLFAHEIVPIQYKKFPLYEILCLFYRMCRTELLFLLRIFDVHIKILPVPEIIHDALFCIPDDHYDVPDAAVVQRLHHILDRWLVCDRKHHL